MSTLSPIVWLLLLALVLVAAVFVGFLIGRRRHKIPAQPPASRIRSSHLSSLHSDVGEDEDVYVDAPQNSPVRPSNFGSATQPVRMDEAKAPELAAGGAAGLGHLQRALHDDHDKLERAWASLKLITPPPGQVPMAMETMSRLATDFESLGRFDAARDVYEHMIELDASWPDVKAKLDQVREQALAAATLTRPAALGGVAAGQQKIGPYLIRGEIGRGAMGAVYLANDPVTGAKIALKTMALSQEFEGDDLADARSRFLREAEMAGRLAHPDIVHILAAGEDKGLAYIAMEYVDGTDMGFFTRPGHLLPVRQLLSIMARVAEALAYAHTKGVTHRDVKPSNIMVDLDKGVVKVMDFGVARVADAARTRTGVVLGTPTYMSPEQLSGQPVDGRSDLYSLGVTLFQLLTGKLPYQHTSMASLMRAIAQEMPPPLSSIRPELPATLDDIVALAMQKHPNTRYSNGHQMAEDLRAI